MSVVTFHFYKELAHLVMLPAVVLIKDFSQGIFSYHHVEISRAQFLPQMQNDRKSLRGGDSTQQIYICKQFGKELILHLHFCTTEKRILLECES